MDQAANGDEGWEGRMAAKHQVTIAAGAGEERRDHVLRAFLPLYEQRDPDEILPQILAARCLGIRYGDPGPALEPRWCRQCWGDRHAWLGNCWGLSHAGGSMSGCEHECHDGEAWMA